jgi:subtilase family serine protease
MNTPARRTFIITAFAAATLLVPLQTSHAVALSTGRTMCGKPAVGYAACLSVKIKAASPAANQAGFGPAQLHTAYGLPCTPGGAPSSGCRTPKVFGPQTIAVVDPYDNPTIESDLAVYDKTYGLAACTKANGCLHIVNQTGGITLPTTVDPAWAIESALDVEMAHMTCQTCKILLTEANSSADLDLAAATNEAALLGATAISLSYGSGEYTTETSLDSLYSHPGIAVVASAGDTANRAEYPASLPGVVSVGGTSLILTSKGTYGTESAWGSTGSGCSAYEAAASWQTNMPAWTSTACTTGRASSDVAMIADSSTGVAMYTSAPGTGGAMWRGVGGTSIGAPIVAGIFALAGGVPAGTAAPSILYQHPGSFRDITTGSAGTCATSMCTASVGYDGPTGLGSPNGISGF